jgi:hypothetical protein
MRRHIMFDDFKMSISDRISIIIWMKYAGTMRQPLHRSMFSINSNLHAHLIEVNKSK